MNKKPSIDLTPDADNSAAGQRKKTRVRAAQRDLTHGMLVDAAVRAFARYGYHKTTIDQIVNEAGASRATFYLYFRSKADLLPELSKRGNSAYYRQFYSKLPEVIHDRNATRSWISDVMEHWNEIEDLFRPVYDATSVDPELYRTLFPEGLPGIENMSQALVQTDLGLDPEKMRVFATALFSPLLYYFRRHLRGDDFNRKVVAEVIADLWTNLLANARKRG